MVTRSARIVKEKWGSESIEKYTVRCGQGDGGPVPYGSIIRAWQKDESFRRNFSTCLENCRFRAFSFETPPVTAINVDTVPFEFVLIKTRMDERQNPDPFYAHFARASSSNRVVAFSNRGGDGVMVVPCPWEGGGGGQRTNFSNIAAFHRTARVAQVRELWYMVGCQLENRLLKSSLSLSSPVWLSTSGHGVSWLHVRLDSRPKYYTHAMYRNEAYYDDVLLSRRSNTFQTQDHCGYRRSNSSNISSLHSNLKPVGSLSPTPQPPPPTDSIPRSQLLSHRSSTWQTQDRRSSFPSTWHTQDRRSSNNTSNINISSLHSNRKTVGSFSPPPPLPPPAPANSIPRSQLLPHRSSTWQTQDLRSSNTSNLSSFPSNRKTVGSFSSPPPLLPPAPTDSIPRSQPPKQAHQHPQQQQQERPQQQQHIPGNRQIMPRCPPLHNNSHEVRASLRFSSRAGAERCNFRQSNNNSNKKPPWR